jgi:hypothetical protein
MRAKSIKGRSTEEVKAALKQSIADGFKPTLAVCFISKAQDRNAISELLGVAGIAIFGCTTNGEFIDEETEKGSAAILLLDINKDNFQIYFEEYPAGNYREVSSSIAKQASERFTTPAFLIGLSHQATDGEEILRGFEDVVGMAVNVFGGCAGDDYSFTEQFVFSNGKESNNAILCIAVDETKVEVKQELTGLTRVGVGPVSVFRTGSR